MSASQASELGTGVLPISEPPEDAAVTDDLTRPELPPSRSPATQPDLSATLEHTMEWQMPTLADVLEARRRISPYLRPTPLFGYAGLDEPVGAFKLRGGVNLISHAYAARLFGVQATICVPEQANPVKVASMRGLGAELVFHGRDFDDAREHCERLASEHGYRYVHSGNEPLLIAGVGTVTLEILEEQPQTDVIVVPVGGEREVSQPPRRGPISVP
jgi:threonine dehydratase